MMDTKLIDETFDLLEQHMDAEAAVRLSRDLPYAEQLARLLSESGLTRDRQKTILGCYILLQLSLGRHAEASEKLAEGAKLARTVLDGDYLMGAYYALMSSRAEMRLFKHLMPVYKRIQLARLAGRPFARLANELFAAFQSYVGPEHLVARNDSESNASHGHVSDAHAAHAADAWQDRIASVDRRLLGGGIASGSGSVASWIARREEVRT